MKEINSHKEKKSLNKENENYKNFRKKSKVKDIIIFKKNTKIKFKHKIKFVEEAIRIII